jgi:hypothetical protein
MHIPSSLTIYSTESKLREWSSLIGIITAIVGNVLISFALNIQRYAHIRLSRQATSKRKTNGYGPQQSEVAEEGAQLNLNARQQTVAMTTRRLLSIKHSVPILLCFNHQAVGEATAGRREEELSTVTVLVGWYTTHDYWRSWELPRLWIRTSLNCPRSALWLWSPIAL